MLGITQTGIESRDMRTRAFVMIISFLSRQESTFIRFWSDRMLLRSGNSSP
jgi:hypothetical protein